MISNDTFIDKAETVVKAVTAEHGLVVNEYAVKKVMKKDLRMSFRKVHGIAWGGNSAQSLILRQQFALSLLKLDFGKKIILNIDEVSDLPVCSVTLQLIFSSCRSYIF